MEGEIKEGRKIQFSVPSGGPIQLDPRQVEMIRRRRPTPATLFRMTDHPSPDEEHPNMPLFACENGVSKASNTDTNVYQPPSLQAVQKMAQAHIKASETPSSESSDSEEVSSDAPGDPPNEIQLKCPSCSGGSAKEEEGKEEAEMTENGESGEKGNE